MKNKLYTFLSVWMVVSMLLPNIVWALGGNPLGTAPTNKITNELAESSSASEVDTSNLPENLPDEVTSAYESLLSGSTVGPSLEPLVGPPLADQGHILFAPAVDLDGELHTNPVTSKPVPVIELLGQKGGIVELAVQLQPDDAEKTAVSVPVTFRVWDSQNNIRYEKTLQSDTWGAARAEVILEDIGEVYTYQAVADGYGQTETRHFRFDPNTISIKLHQDGVSLSYRQELERWVVFTLESPVALDPARDVVELTAVRQPTKATLDKIRQDLQMVAPGAEQLVNELGPMSFPTILMEIVDTHTAQVRLQLPHGEYGFMAMVEVNGATTEYFHSEALRLHMTNESANMPNTLLWASEIEYEPGLRLGIRENEVGYIRFDLVTAETAVLAQPDPTTAPKNSSTLCKLAPSSGAKNGMKLLSKPW